MDKPAPGPDEFGWPFFVLESEAGAPAEALLAEVRARRLLPWEEGPDVDLPARELAASPAAFAVWRERDDAPAGLRDAVGRFLDENLSPDERRRALEAGRRLADEAERWNAVERGAPVARLAAEAGVDPAALFAELDAGRLFPPDDAWHPEHDARAVSLATLAAWLRRGDVDGSPLLEPLSRHFDAQPDRARAVAVEQAEHLEYVRAYPERAALFKQSNARALEGLSARAPADPADPAAAAKRKAKRDAQRRARKAQRRRGR